MFVYLLPDSGFNFIVTAEVAKIICVAPEQNKSVWSTLWIFFSDVVNRSVSPQALGANAFKNPLFELFKCIASVRDTIDGLKQFSYMRLLVAIFAFELPDTSHSFGLNHPTQATT